MKPNPEQEITKEEIQRAQKRIAEEIREIELKKKIALWFLGFIVTLYLARLIYESLK